MDDQLLGYVLDALDPADKAAVEERLRDDAAASERLDLIRRALAPLEADREPDEPPPGLYVRAVGRAAEWLCRPDRPPPPSAPAPPTTEVLPFVPPPPSDPELAAPPPMRFRRWDAVAAAVLLVGVLGVGLPALSAMQNSRLRSECANNMRVWYAAFSGYSDTQDDKRFPFIRREPPYNRPADFVPILSENGLLPDDPANLTCPADGRRPARAAGQERGRVPTAYAYTLGYQAENRLHPVCRPEGEADADRMPLMADRPPASFLEPVRRSVGRPMHGRVVNVLYSGGHVEACDNPRVGIGGDHIYLNRHDRIEAGVDWTDGVLAEGEVNP